MLARKIIESLNVSPIYFIVAFNLSQNLSLIAGICIYDCKPIQLADDSADILLKLERRGVLSPEQNDIVTSELDLLFKKRIEKILAS